MSVRLAVPDEYPRLVEIWRSSVDATHQFLRPSDRDEIERNLPDSFPRVRLVVAEVDGRAVGFAGTAGKKLEMLFVDAEHWGTGVGSALLAHVVEDVGILRVDVNEDNVNDVAFYRQRGFVAVERTAVDDHRPYPVLRMHRVAEPNVDPYPGRYLPPDYSSVAEDYFSVDQLPAQRYSRESYRVTRRHRQLLAETDSGTWSPGRQALAHCLARLATSVLTESWCVGVLDGWADTEVSFRVVYRLGTHPATLGIRRQLADDDRFPDGRPEWLGPEVADFGIGEPLGSTADRLLPVGGIHWWGDLE